LNKCASIVALLITPLCVCIAADVRKVPTTPALAKIPYLGIAFRWRHDSNSDKYLHVERVSSDSPAQIAGIQPGDIIARIQDVPVGFGDELDFLLFMNARKVGERISLDLIRAGARRRVVVTLGELPETRRTIWERNLAIAKQRRLAGASVH
jgi:S1-C subfamily serine protease